MAENQELLDRLRAGADPVDVYREVICNLDDQIKETSEKFKDLREKTSGANVPRKERKELIGDYHELLETLWAKRNSLYSRYIDLEQIRTSKAGANKLGRSAQQANVDERPPPDRGERLME